ncbi:HD domain-containing protein [Solirubrobacter soli]|uniref:HD domain-containing protein n=1 Tax=Solirubrobacter soli TaxID=363832 RepID=UPI00069F1756|nr:HD domain-containing protein [Solirubrobacter soli]
MEPPFADGRPTVLAAVAWASHLHGDQVRSVDRAPFVLHPLEVASLLYGRGFDDDVIVAGVLHDLVENTEASVADVGERFGERVATIVDSVSEDDSIADYGERKAELRARACAAGPEARAVYTADKISKARELRAQAAHDPSVLVDPQNVLKLEHYEASLTQLLAVGDDQPMVDQLAFELWALRTLPPQ